jgi:hypothetical protein
MLPFGGGLFSLLFMAVFIVILGTFVFRMVIGIKQWQSNNSQPVLTVEAKVVAKRTEIHRHTSNTNGQMMTTNSTSYFATFQVQSGDRMELKVHSRDYGLLAEGDAGRLTFQGTRFQGFERTSK